MTDMPEAIWAGEPDIFDNTGIWVDSTFDPGVRDTLYVHADVVEARIAEAVAKEREAIVRIFDEKSAFWNKLARNTKDAEYRATYAILASTTRDDAKAIRSRAGPRDAGEDRGHDGG